MQIRKITVFIILISSISLTMACSMPFLSEWFSQPQTEISELLATSDPNATVTSTPFQPMIPTATAPVAATQEIIEPTAIPTRMAYTSDFYPGYRIPPRQIHILVLGSDWRPSSGYRTDTIMLVSINPENGSVSTVSFPRDLYVEIPGYGIGRINTAQPKGFNVMADTFEYNFGVRPDFYIMTNFQGFIQTINSLGGIDVTASQNLTDRCDLPQAVNGYCSYGPGVMHMDGNTALWYVRSRYSTSDFDRERRSQEVLKGMFLRLMNLDVVNRVPELYDIYRQNVETNLTLEIISPLVEVAPHLIEDDLLIRPFKITQAEVTPYRVPESGAQVLLPNENAIRGIIRQAFFEIIE
jgi:polyisoprenyl-teichoic acid--peptidoglycan teichoic acid transferase